MAANPQLGTRCRQAESKTASQQHGNSDHSRDCPCEGFDEITGARIRYGVDLLRPLFRCAFNQILHLPMNTVELSVRYSELKPVSNDPEKCFVLSKMTEKAWNDLPLRITDPGKSKGLHTC